MKHVDIYLENAGKSVKKKEGWYGYVLAYQGTQLYTREARLGNGRGMAG